MSDEERPEQGGVDAYFFRLVATFEAAAMQQLGKIASPITGEVDVSLEGARDSIDMLDMMRRKCDGNLSPNEERLLDHVLYQLRMNYVEVSREGPKAASPEDAASDEPRPPESNESEDREGPAGTPERGEGGGEAP